FFNDPATPALYTLSLHDALPISVAARVAGPRVGGLLAAGLLHRALLLQDGIRGGAAGYPVNQPLPFADGGLGDGAREVGVGVVRSEEHTSELQSLTNLVCRLLLE